MSLDLSSCSSMTNVQTQLPSCELHASTCSGLNPRHAHVVCAQHDLVAYCGMLKLGDDVIDAVHVEPEQILDPVVRVGATTRRRAHLRQPRPDRGSRGVYRYRAGRDTPGWVE